MACAKRRDEWDRWSQLLSLVDCRTAYGDDCKPKSPWEWMPPELDTDGQRRAVSAALAKRVVKVTSEDVKAMQGI